MIYFSIYNLNAAVDLLHATETPTRAGSNPCAQRAMQSGAKVRKGVWKRQRVLVRAFLLTDFWGKNNLHTGARAARTGLDLNHTIFVKMKKRHVSIYFVVSNCIVYWRQYVFLLKTETLENTTFNFISMINWKAFITPKWFEKIVSPAVIQYVQHTRLQS